MRCIFFLWCIQSFAVAFCTLVPERTLQVLAPATTVVDFSVDNFSKVEKDATFVHFDDAVPLLEMEITKTRLEEVKNILHRNERSGAPRATLEGMRLQVRHVELELALQKEKHKAFIQKAPFTGYIKWQVTPGQTVSAGTPVATISSTMQVCEFLAAHTSQTITLEGPTTITQKPVWLDAVEPVSQKVIGQAKVEWPQGTRVKVHA